MYTSEHYLKEKQFISLKDHATTTESYKYPERHVKIVILKEELADYDFTIALDREQNKLWPILYYVLQIVNHSRQLKRKRGILRFARPRVSLSDR